MKKSSKKISKAVAIISVVFVLIVSLSTSFVAWNITSDGTGTKQLDENISNAVSVVDDFEYALAGETALFTDELYSKANLVASQADENSTDEELQKLVRYLYIDSIRITDTEGKIIASYPSDLKGGNIRDNEETKQFSKVLKGVSFKSQSPAKAVDGGYSLYTCVGRPDGKGVAIIASTESDYGKLLGENIALDCSDNTIIAKGDEIVSSSFADNDKATLGEMGITEDKLTGSAFILDVNGEEYLCRAQTKDNYTVLCAVSNAGADSQAMTVLVITLAADLIAFVIVFAVVMILGKKKTV